MITHPQKSNQFSVFCWNIGNPSKERGIKQADWLRKRKENVFVLTETKRSDGCDFISKYLSSYGFTCISSSPESDYGVLIASRSKTAQGNFQKHFNFLPSRVVSALIETETGTVELAGIYIPSRDASPEKIARKSKFIEATQQALVKGLSGNRTIFCGDLNILEPNHVPRYRFFAPWEYSFYDYILNCGYSDCFRMIQPDQMEYSWVGRTGDGYRYDHCFVSNDLKPHITHCWYDHSPRESRLSDHSGIVLELDI